MKRSLHTGISPHRWEDNPLEKTFAKMWKAEQEDPLRGGSILEWILSPENRRDGSMTDRDAMTAATVIQWLGSPVGQDFFRRMMKVYRTHQTTTQST